MNSADTLTTDVFCLRCNYNLRSLAITANCPECELPIAVTMEEGQLRFSSPEHLSTLHSAMIFLIFGSVLSLCYELVHLIVGFRNAWILSLIQLPALMGLWWLATPNPHTAEVGLVTGLRKFLRVSVMISIVDFAILLLPWAKWRWMPLAYMFLLSITFLLLGYAGEVALMLYVRVLADRIPNAKLARFAKQLAWAIAMIACLSVTAHFMRYEFNATWMRRLVPSQTFEVLLWTGPVINLASVLLFRSMAGRLQEQLDDIERASNAARET
jgi:hypothetical protein